MLLQYKRKEKIKKKARGMMPFGRSGPLWLCRAITAHKYFN